MRSENGSQVEALQNRIMGRFFLRALTTNATSEVDIFGHDGDTLGMDGTQVGVLKQANQVSLSGLLKCHNSSALEAKVGLEILGDFADETLEGSLPKKG